MVRVSCRCAFASGRSWGRRRRRRLPAPRGMPADAAGTSRWRAYRRLFCYAAPYRRGWAGIAAGTLLTTVLSLVQPWPIKILVDHVLGDAPMSAALARVAG